MEFKYGEQSIYVGNSPEDYKAIIEYKPVEGKDNVVEAYHTRVKEELGGQGVAAKLVKELADRARKEGFKVIPTCSYAEAKMKDNEEYADVVYKD